MRVLGVLLAIAAGLMAQPAFDSQNLLDGFLKQRGVFYDYTIQDLQKELEVQKKLGF